MEYTFPPLKVKSYSTDSTLSMCGKVHEFDANQKFIAASWYLIFYAYRRRPSHQNALFAGFRF